MSNPEMYGGLLQSRDANMGLGKAPEPPQPGNGPLYAALAKAQRAFKPILRTKTVRVTSAKGNYTFDYAPLESVLDATREALAENELALFQLLGHEGSELCLTTTLGHSSGCKVYSRVVIPQTTTGYGDNKSERPKTAQEIGSAVTYMRRYMAQCVLGVNAEEDDDGAQGEDMQRETSQRPRTAPTPPKVERPKPAPQSAPPRQATQQEALQSPGDQAARQAGPLNGEALEAAKKLDAALAKHVEGLVAEPSVPPPPADGPKPTKETMTKMRELVVELGMQKMVPEWCQKLLGIPPAKIALESQVLVLIADLEQRKAATP